MAAGREGGQKLGEEALRAADYITDVTKELSEIARGSRLHMLAYLLDIAHLEASENAGRPTLALEALQSPRTPRG